MRITELYWDDNNAGHLWAAHHVTVEEIEELVFGSDDEPARYLVQRDGDYYRLAGRTADGRVLVAVGEFMRDRRFRVFAARDATAREKRRFLNR